MRSERTSEGGKNVLRARVLRMAPSHLVPVFIFIFALTVYLYTLAPTIGFIDAGELTVVCHTLGIAHPTGYPVYTVLGRLATLIPLGEVAWRLNFVSALYAALSAAFLYLALFRLGDFAGGVSSSLLFAFSSTLWSQATQAEVYSLTALLCTLLLWSVLSGQVGTRKLLIFSFALGLSLGNHMIVFTLALPCIVYLAVRVWSRIHIGVYFLSLLLFLLGLSVYLYLPIRSAQNPILNWGDPEGLVNFLRHVSGKQYRVWMFTGSLALIRSHLGNFLRLLLHQFHPFLLLLCFLGIWSLRGRGVGLLLGLIFLLNLFYGVNYDIPDIEPYFLPAFLIAAIWAGVGLSSLLSLIRKKLCAREAKAPLLSGAVIALSLVPLFAHFPVQNRARDHLAYDFGSDVLRSMEEGGICLVNDWDIYSPILYLRYVQGMRGDVVMIDKELLRRSWYFHYLEHQYPWLIEGSRMEVQSYLAQLRNFEEGTLKDPQEIQKRFIAMINSFIRRNIEERPVYLTFIDGADRDAPSIGIGHMKVPQGLVYWVGNEPPPPEPDYLSFSPRGAFDESVPKDERSRLRLSRYPRMTLERGVYELRRGNLSGAVPLLRHGLRWGWNPALFHGNLGMCFLGLGEYGKASLEFNAVLRIDPKNREALRALSAIEDIVRRQEKG